MRRECRSSWLLVRHGHERVLGHPPDAARHVGPGLVPAGAGASVGVPEVLADLVVLLGVALSMLKGGRVRAAARRSSGAGLVDP